MKNSKFTIAYVLGSVALVSMLLAATTLSAYIKEDRSGGSYGEVALRSYFERGGGDSEDDPYIITRPRHLYNLSRLQALGAFNTKKYFQLGLEGLGGYDYGCYTDDINNTVVPYLDMGSANSSYYHNRITAIGSEVSPFYGEFDGKNVEIKNLTVFADPEDAGLFGYTATDSVVENLFLTNITINTMGYHNEHADLYGSNSTASNGVALNYTRGPSISKSFSVNSSEYDSYTYELTDAYVTAYKTWAADKDNEPEPVLPSDTLVPVITLDDSTAPSGFQYKALMAGNYLVRNKTTGAISVDMAKVFNFFAENRDNVVLNATSLVAASSVSIVAYKTDEHGVSHSKVIMTLTVSFTMYSTDPNEIIFDVSASSDHSNNIGLIIGHCDGTIKNCYVNDGSFEMNKGDIAAESEEGHEVYNALEHHSSFGLIGLVGSTVRNKASRDAADSAAGKDVGVLDFTTIYNDVIQDDSFSYNAMGSYDTWNGTVLYKAKPSSHYKNYLRYHSDYGDHKYVTVSKDSISFLPKKVIQNDELGVFTIATHYTGDGYDGYAHDGVDKSVVKHRDVAVTLNGDDNDPTNDETAYFLYYATGEYKKNEPGTPTFSEYRSSFDSYTPSRFFPGYYFPNYGQVTADSFRYREMYQNYFFRFKLEPSYRTGKGFYFSDLKVGLSSPGGSFLSKYFEYKLVDEDAHSIPSGTPRSGVMLRNSFGSEIRSFAGSFATPDNDKNSSSQMWCINDPNVDGTPVANMVNFEITTDMANVTVVASPSDGSHGAALGVYRLDTSSTTVTDGLTNYPIKFDEPDYAFFMPSQDHLAYFDYRINNSRKGEIGVYDNSGNFTEATVHTSATIASSPSHIALDENENQYHKEYGYENGKPRLFVHTFTLPQGSYCLGSPTGSQTKTNGNSGNALCTADIFYVCAQGQNDGSYSISPDLALGDNVVESVDFTKVPRWINSTTKGIEPDPNNNGQDNYIDNVRCYVLLDGSETKKAIFTANPNMLSFEYTNGQFVIDTDTLAYITRITANTYGQSKGFTNTAIKLLTLDPSSESVTYPQ